MISVRTSKFEELNEFSILNKQHHVVNHLSIKSLEVLKQEFENENYLFLSIVLASGQLAGYIILVTGDNLNTIQLKRILVNENHLGIGQKAIKEMENYCRTVLKINRIWLDVFKNNSRAIHIYEKLGYKVFKEGEEGLREVIFYEKNSDIVLKFAHFIHRTA